MKNLSFQTNQTRGWAWWAAWVVFALTIAPTFISYAPYKFHWDDSDYLWQALAVSRAFWQGQAHGIEHLREVRSAMYSIRPPAMTLLALPWGPKRSWDVVGECFVSLDCAISVLAALCLFLLARIGVGPLYLLLACGSVCAALGPWPANSFAHHDAAAFMADSLFSWTILAALLLIPYEARTDVRSTGHAVGRGILWGFVLTLGLMTKISFLYFVLLILPALLLVRYLQARKLRHLLAAASACALVASPAIAYLARHGASSFQNGGMSSFGPTAQLYKASLWGFAGASLQDSPGLAVPALFLIAALAVVAARSHSWKPNADSAALFIALGFAIIVLASVNRQLRYSFPSFVALPFLLAVMLTAKKSPAPRRTAVLIAGLAALIMAVAAVPTLHRAQRSDSLARADAVLARAEASHARTILLATNSPTLNTSLMRVALGVSANPSSALVADLASNALLQLPIEDDFDAIRRSDLIVFQDDEKLKPKFTNLRVPDYRRYMLQQSGLPPLRIGGEVSLYANNPDMTENRPAMHPAF